MDFEIKNVLQKMNLKKFAIPAVFITAGLGAIVYFKKKTSNINTSTASGSTMEYEQNSGSGNDSLDSAIQQLNSSITATQSNIESVRKENQDTLTGLQKSVAEIIAESNSYNGTQISNLSTQLTSYQQTANKELNESIAKLNEKMVEKVSNPVYNPSSSSSSGSSSGSSSVASSSPSVSVPVNTTPVNTTPVVTVPKDAGAIKNDAGKIVGGQGGGKTWGSDVWDALWKS